MNKPIAIVLPPLRQRFAGVSIEHLSIIEKHVVAQVSG
jgi:hypothetical protein